jgi:uncharacterized membrane protein
MSYQEEKFQRETSLSYREKSVIAAMITSFVIYGIFSVAVYQRYQAGSFDTSEVLLFWGRAILILAGVIIVFQILTQIALAIINTIVTREEEDPSFEDERDKLIELRGRRVSANVFAIGFLLAMALLAFGQPPTVMFVTLMAFMIGSDIVESLYTLYLYRRGF